MFLLLCSDEFLSCYYQELHKTCNIIPRDYNPKKNPCTIMPKVS